MKWRASRGQPDAEVGQDGDLCIDMDGGYVFQKVLGVWSCYGRAWP